MNDRCKYCPNRTTCMTEELGTTLDRADGFNIHFEGKLSNILNGVLVKDKTMDDNTTDMEDK